MEQRLMRFNLLEPLRGLAALWVLCFHFGFSEAFSESFPVLTCLFAQGDLGVPMFFVISGFCVTASARSAIRHGESSMSFMYRRARRIYPPFWFSILVVISLPFLIELISALKTGQFVAPSAENLNYGFLNYSFVDWLRVVSLTQVFSPMPGITNLQAKFTSINAVYWTLAIE
ncbi:MAG TPA: acyltransferase family protein, partial [Gemmataceae bacterium]|nr:acyltransferase family protein [Gemmataceae bacterium]